jgi:hypothetical protein
VAGDHGFPGRRRLGRGVHAPVGPRARDICGRPDGARTVGVALFPGHQHTHRMRRWT